MKKSKPKTIPTISSGTFNEFVRTDSGSNRRSIILRISGDGNRNIAESHYLTECVLIESEVILNKKGNKFQVTKGKRDKRKFKEGNCYLNSVEMMKKGYGYVEGYVKRKQDGYKFGHAWNVDSNGNHIDYTLDDPENYDYFGVKIPEKTVWNIGWKNGKTWYAVLPFIDDLSELQD